MSRRFRCGAMIGAMLACGPAAAHEFSSYTGAELYARFCEACHGPQGYGDGPVAKALAVAVPDLTRIARRNEGRFPADRVREVIDGREVVVAHGTRYMPVWGYEFWVETGANEAAELEAAAIVDKLLEHLRSIQQFTAEQP